MNWKTEHYLNQMHKDGMKQRILVLEEKPLQKLSEIVFVYSNQLHYEDTNFKDCP